jgi:hypothetical protein
MAATGNITITVNGVAQTVDVTTNAIKVNKEKVTIDAARFPEGATVSVQVPAGAFKDKAGNNFTGLAASAWTFTTVDAQLRLTTRLQPLRASPRPTMHGRSRERQTGNHLQRRSNSRNR